MCVFPCINVHISNVEVIYELITLGPFGTEINSTDLERFRFICNLFGLAVGMVTVIHAHTHVPYDWEHVLSYRAFPNAFVTDINSVQMLYLKCKFSLTIDSLLCALSSVGPEQTVPQEPEDSWTRQDGVLNFRLCLNGLEASMRTNICVLVSEFPNSLRGGKSQDLRQKAVKKAVQGHGAVCVCRRSCDLLSKHASVRSCDPGVCNL